MKRFLWIGVSTLITVSSSAACLWDRDTVKSEAEGLHDVISVISGRFPRNPPAYFEMRVERVTSELKTEPDQLALYDDVAVACDRLGRADDAIGWGTRKKLLLDKRDDATQRYRYLANSGTFLAHKWFREGAEASRLAELDQARKVIADAIQLNPDAHFGREHFQLILVDTTLIRFRWVDFLAGMILWRIRIGYGGLV
ncbi:MAG: hypothetical protein R3F19_30045 [Verrucomicrobiales bacterium]